MKKKCSNSKRVILPTKEKRNKTGASKAQLVSSRRRRRTKRRRQKQQLSRDKQTNKSSNEWDKTSKRFMCSCLSALLVLCTPCLPACLPAQCLPLCQVQSSNPATIKMFWKMFSSSSPPKKLLNFFLIKIKIGTHKSLILPNTHLQEAMFHEVLKKNKTIWNSPPIIVTLVARFFFSICNFSSNFAM